jgi:hypothetical protein
VLRRPVNSGVCVLPARAYLLIPNAANAETIYAGKLNTLGTIRIVVATTKCTSCKTKIRHHAGA